MGTETVVCLTCGGPAARGDRVCPWCSAGIVEVRPAAAPGASAVPASAVPVRKTFCPHCTRLYAETDAACPRCVAPDAPAAVEPFWGANAPRGGRGEKGSRCPACSGGLAVEAMGKVSADRCEACGGRWFDTGELARVVDLSTWGAAADRVEALEREAKKGAPANNVRRGKACVRCRARMFRRLVAPRGPVYVDVCARHGIWFDDGEFESFRAFVAGGGLEIARARADAPPPPRRKVHLISDPPGGTGPHSLFGVLDAVFRT